MGLSIREIIATYNPDAHLSEASTPPSSWYTDPRILELEQKTVLSQSWQFVGRTNQLGDPGNYITCDVAGEPIVVVVGNDNVPRGFFNVCRHHAAAVMTKSEGRTENLRCPYHGWTYNLEGALILTPEFGGVANFDRAANGLVPVQTAVWQNWVFVKLDGWRSVTRRFSRQGSHRTFRTLEPRTIKMVRTPPLYSQLQLESLRRQLSRRRLSRPAYSRRFEQRTRLQQLQDRNWRALLCAVEPDRAKCRRG